MNNFKLLYCGRINFWNASRSRPKDSLPPTVLEAESGEFSTSISTDESEESSRVFLGSSHEVISDKVCPPLNKKRRGQAGITSHGRAQVRGGCRMLEERHGVTNLTFLTATLPDSAIALCTPRSWAIAVNRLCKKLRYHLNRVGLSDEIVACVEIQEKRLARTNGVPPLHLHLVFQGRQPYGHWLIDKLFYQELWVETYKSVWQQSEVSLAACRTESIRSSSVSYMGKYMSKGGAVLKRCQSQLLPSAWYSVSSKVKDFLKQSTVTGSSYLAEGIFEYLQSSDLLRWARDIWSSAHGDGSSYLVGWVGDFRDRWDYQELVKFVAAQEIIDPVKNPYTKYLTD